MQPLQKKKALYKQGIHHRVSGRRGIIVQALKTAPHVPGGVTSG